MFDPDFGLLISGPRLAKSPTPFAVSYRLGWRGAGDKLYNLYPGRI